MISITLNLSDILTDPANPADLTTLSEQEATERLTTLYSFLPDATVTVENGRVTVTSPAGQKPHLAQRSRDRAARQATRGRYQKAISIYEKALDQDPLDIDARREIGMAYLELGDAEQAEKYLLQAVNLAPDDAYIHLLLANLYLGRRQQPEIAAPFYERALAIAPRTPTSSPATALCWASKRNTPRPSKSSSGLSPVSPPIPTPITA